MLVSQSERFGQKWLHLLHYPDSVQTLKLSHCSFRPLRSSKGKGALLFVFLEVSLWTWQMKQGGFVSLSCLGTRRLLQLVLYFCISLWCLEHEPSWLPDFSCRTAACDCGDAASASDSPGAHWPINTKNQKPNCLQRTVPSAPTTDEHRRERYD